MGAGTLMATGMLTQFYSGSNRVPMAPEVPTNALRGMKVLGWHPLQGRTRQGFVPRDLGAKPEFSVHSLSFHDEKPDPSDWNTRLFVPFTTGVSCSWPARLLCSASWLQPPS